MDPWANIESHFGEKLKSIVEVTLMSNEERPAGCFGYIGDEILPSYVGIFKIVNHYKDPVIKQPVFHGKYPAIFFFVAHMIYQDRNWLQSCNAVVKLTKTARWRCAFWRRTPPCWWAKRWDLPGSIKGLLKRMCL